MEKEKITFISAATTTKNISSKGIRISSFLRPGFWDTVVVVVVLIEVVSEE